MDLRDRGRSCTEFAEDVGTLYIIVLDFWIFAVFKSLRSEDESGQKSGQTFALFDPCEK